MTKRRKHVPLRTCIGCRQTTAKRDLIRVVRSQDGVQIDPTGKQAGRGAYIHPIRKCWEIALKGSLMRALKTELSKKELERLSQYADTFSDVVHELDTDTS